MYQKKHLVEPSSPVQKVWKTDLYKLQSEAPTPKPFHCNELITTEIPNYFGEEYHGIMNHLECEKLLKNQPDGTYLIRKSPTIHITDTDDDKFHTLSIRFNERTKHFKIYYKTDIGFFLQENFKNYETIYEMVADGLINFYMQLHAGPIMKEMISQINYHQSPYMTLNRRKLRALSNDIRKSIEPVEKFLDSEIALSKNLSQNDEIDVLPIVYEKPHKFKINTFKGLNWCEYCANFLWGFTAQGVKCEECGFIAHNKCSELVPPKCVPDLKKIRGVFGTDLTTLVQAHKCKIPFVVKCCINEIEHRGILSEGIYRVSGFADEIEALKLALDKNGDKTDMSENAYSNVNVIAGTLKLFLRLLPIPLITFEVYPLLMNASSEKSLTEQIVALRIAIKQLPPAHYNSLKILIEHLKRIASHFTINKMNEQNLATVFAPTLINTPQHLTDLSQEIFMLTTLISNCQSIFS